MSAHPTLVRFAILSAHARQPDASWSLPHAALCLYPVTQICGCGYVDIFAVCSVIRESRPAAKIRIQGTCTRPSHRYPGSGLQDRQTAYLLQTQKAVTPVWIPGTLTFEPLPIPVPQLRPSVFLHSVFPLGYTRPRKVSWVVLVLSSTHSGVTQRGNSRRCRHCLPSSGILDLPHCGQQSTCA